MVGGPVPRRSVTNWSLRVRDHDTHVDELVTWLIGRGVAARAIKSSAHRPDIELPGNVFVEVKCPLKQFLTVEPADFDTWVVMRARGESVLIATRYQPRGDSQTIRWYVDTPDTLVTRIEKGPRRGLPDNSGDDWLYIRKGGTPLEEWWP